MRRILSLAVAVAAVCVAQTPERLWAAPPELLKVAYLVTEEKGSWQPIEPDDLARVVEQSVLEVLTTPGLLQLERVEPAALAKSPQPYVIRVLGRTVAEAETHSVHILFEPLTAADLPSFRAVDTVVIGKRARAAILDDVEKSAHAAAKQLLAVLQPALAMYRPGAPAAAPVALEKQPLPWRWSEVKVPSPTVAHAADLKAKDGNKQRAALRELTSLALTDSAPRQALESCALTHPDQAMRLGCLVALRPLSRRIAATQRVVIEVFRKDKDDRVRSEADEQMQYFTGLSREEAILAWLERAAAGGVHASLEKLGDLPNLDLVVARCILAGSDKVRDHTLDHRGSCIELAAPMSPARRRAVLMPFIKELDPSSPYYLEGAGEGEGSRGTEWQWAVEAVLEGTRTFDPEIEEILWRRYERTLSATAIRVLAEQAPASEKLATRMLEVLQSKGGFAALNAISRIGKEAPALRPMIREKLAEMLALGTYHKSTSKQRLKQLVKELGDEPKSGKEER